jgi:ATP-binding cassette, subfamily B, bacterial CvaB/MchF/RaxB
MSISDIRSLPGITAPTFSSADDHTGAQCVIMMAEMLGRNPDTSLHSRLDRINPGNSPDKLLSFAEELDLTGRLLKTDSDQLHKVSFPAIIQLDDGRYAIVKRVRGGRAHLLLASGKTYWEKLDQLGRYCTGRIIELRVPTSFGGPRENSRLGLGTLLDGTKGLSGALVQTIVLSIFVQVAALASPYYLQLAIDNAFIGQNAGIMGALAFGFGILVVFNGLALYLRSTVLSTISNAFLYRLAADLSRKLFRLPIGWFGSRALGETLIRFRSIALIKQLLSEDLAAGLVDSALALLTLSLMILYSPLLSLISICAFFIDLGVRSAISRPQRRNREEFLALSGQEHSILLENIRAIRSIRLANLETKRQGIWQAKAAALLNADLRFQDLANIQAAVQRTISALENIAVVWASINLVIQGSLSLGMVVAYLAYKTQFLTTAGSAAERIFSVRLLRPALDQIGDIALGTDDPAFDHPQFEARSFEGKIELRDVYYRYADDLPFVLKGVNLLVEPGQSIVITGVSGGGKTTLLQIVLGILKPTSGEILLDGVPLPKFGYRNYYNNLGVVLQDDSFFAGSIGANIAMFAEGLDMAEVRRAADLASIIEDIERMPMGYQSMLDETGAPLSGGQRQRLLLARALYRRPQVLVVDEGTSQLDEPCEESVNQALAGLKMTRVIVAHRQATIAASERVLRLVDGVLFEGNSWHGRVAP